MKKENLLSLAAMIIILIASMSACDNSTEKSASNENLIESAKISEDRDDLSQSIDTDDKDKSDKRKDLSDARLNEMSKNTNNMVSVNTPNETKEDNNVGESDTKKQVTKIEGRRIEFIEKLDNLQKELDALPEKEDSDKGVTNAMKNYYGISYEMYDKALNEIYALLKEELSPEVMEELKSKQLKWIERKEEKANEERKKYEGGTFGNVAYYISLYESTKEKCYELVNDYFTD